MDHSNSLTHLTLFFSRSFSLREKPLYVIRKRELIVVVSLNEQIDVNFYADVAENILPFKALFIRYIFTKFNVS